MLSKMNGPYAAWYIHKLINANTSLSYIPSLTSVCERGSLTDGSGRSCSGSEGVIPKAARAQLLKKMWAPPCSPPGYKVFQGHLFFPHPSLGFLHKFSNPRSYPTEATLTQQVHVPGAPCISRSLCTPSRWHRTALWAAAGSPPSRTMSPTGPHHTQKAQRKRSRCGKKQPTSCHLQTPLFCEVWGPECGAVPPPRRALLTPSLDQSRGSLPVGWTMAPPMPSSNP